MAFRSGVPASLADEMPICRVDRGVPDPVLECIDAECLKPVGWYVLRLKQRLSANERQRKPRNQHCGNAAKDRERQAVAQSPGRAERAAAGCELGAHVGGFAAEVGDDPAVRHELLDTIDHPPPTRRGLVPTLRDARALQCQHTSS